MLGYQERCVTGTVVRHDDAPRQEVREVADHAVKRGRDAVKRGRDARIGRVDAVHVLRACVVRRCGPAAG